MSSLMRVAVENSMKTRRDQEQRRSRRNRNQPPRPLINSTDEALRILQALQGPRNPDAGLGKASASSVNKRFVSPLADYHEMVRKITISQYAVDKYNPPAIRPSQASSAGSSSMCLDPECESSTVGRVEGGKAPATVPRFNTNKENNVPTVVGIGASSMPPPKTSKILAIGSLVDDSEEREKEERRVEAYYKAVSLNLPSGTIYVAYLSRLPPDWERPFYQCGDDECTFHSDMNAGQLYKFAQQRECERAMDLTEKRMLAPPKIKFHWQLYTNYTVKEASNLHTAVARFAYPSMLAAASAKTMAWDDRTRLWEDQFDSDDDDIGTDDTGYETDLTTYTNRMAKVPTRVTVTRVTPALKKKKSIVMQRRQRHKNIQSAVNRNVDFDDNVVFGDDDDDDEIFDRST
ncbi:hypothetical protein EV426DRAFT_702104 [Tirmania nivea]|nr:hypothetical protein EV426DRAFT_702104 [Tirmania nivea]